MEVTTYERDSESNLDYAINRYHNSKVGRFMSPDLLAGHIHDPQSLNRFAYTLNDPINGVDPLGLDDYTFYAYGWYHPGDGAKNGGGNGGGDGYSQMGIVNSDPGYDKGGGGGVDLSSIKTNKKIITIFFCLWQAGGYGRQSTERSLWLIQPPEGEVSGHYWPWGAESGHESWKGAPPENSVAIVHTHPDATSPKPSTGGTKAYPKDDYTANTVKMPVLVVTRGAVWAQIPDQKEPVKVLDNGWTEAIAKEKPKCPDPNKTK